MKRLFLGLFLCTSMAAAQNTTVVSHPGLFLTRVNVFPEKAATLAGFQCLFGSVAFIPAAIMTVVVKRHTAGSNAPDMKGVIGTAPWPVAFATAAGTIFGGVSLYLFSQGISNLADAAASKIWNPVSAVAVKTPFAVLP